MPLSESPRKVVPLALPSDSEPSSRRTTITKRMFFCGVVVENEPGQPLPEGASLIPATLWCRIAQTSCPRRPRLGRFFWRSHFKLFRRRSSSCCSVRGRPINISEFFSSAKVEEAAPSQSVSLSSQDGPTLRTRLSGLTVCDFTLLQNPNTRKPVTTDASPIQDVINELVSTERSYVKRLRILKYDYADPLRSFARSRDTAIIPPYEAKTLFGNVDNLLPVNERFLEDLEKMVADDGPETVGYVGDVALRHFKELRGFDQYRTYYTKREEAQLIFEREMAKRGSGFASYVDVRLYISLFPDSTLISALSYSASSTPRRTPKTESVCANCSWIPSNAFPDTHCYFVR